MENKNYIAAIDLGSRNVVVAVASRAADGKIEIEDVVVAESAGIAGGEVKNVESAAAAMKKAVAEIESRLGLRIAEAFTGISGSHIRCVKHPYYVHVAGRDGEINAEDVRKLNESMHNIQAPEGYKLMHILPQHYLVNDSEEVLDPVGRFGRTLGSTFNLIVGENTIITRHDKAFAKVGIGQAKSFINPLATAEAVVLSDEKELGVAVVDIGAGLTDVTIYQEGIVRNVSVIPLGADAVNRDIRAYGIMERYVEDLKTMYGCAVAEMVDGERFIKVPGRMQGEHKDILFRTLASIIEARMSDIVDYVIEEIREAGYEGRLGAGIVLTGGAANLKEIRTLFENRTGLEVRIARPELLITESSREKAADPTLATVVGLLWQGMNSGLATRVEPMQSETFGQTPVVEQPRTEDEDYGSGRGGKRRQKPPKEEKKKRREPDWDNLDAEGEKKGVFGRIGGWLGKKLEFDDEVLDEDDTNI